LRLAVEVELALPSEEVGWSSVLRLMAASHAPVAPLSLTLRTHVSATQIKIVVAALALLSLAVAGLVLALSLPNEAATQPGSFLGSSRTAP